MEKSIVLIGMMGSGKSTVGRLLSRTLDLPFLDMDSIIETREGRSISKIFEENGESYFRDVESQVLREVLNGPVSVVATGGGIVLSQKNRDLIKQRAIPIFLYTDPKVLVERLSDSKDRPLLRGDELKKRINSIWSQRRALYEEFENRVDTSHLTPQEVAIEIIYRFLPHKEFVEIGRGILLGIGVTEEIYTVLKKENYKPPLLIVTSSGIWNRWGRYVEETLGDFKWDVIFLPDGERAKSMEYVYDIWEKMFSLGFTRRNPVLLLGGGTVGDTGGFAASTFMRGVPLFQLPTTLLSQVDSSIGGKRGVNYKHLKNMIGTFYDAEFTLLDPLFLLTLPEREIRAGLSEAIKAGIIGDPSLFEFIEDSAKNKDIYDLFFLKRVIEGGAGVKLKVVGEDPYETKGYRKVLNLGHTLGHALEGYEDFPINHGEGVAIGMVFASFLGKKMGITPDSVLERIENVIKDLSLPYTFPKRLVEKAVKKMYYDKKREDEKLFWVIPEEIGKVRFYKFSADDVKDALYLFCEEYPYNPTL